MEDKDDITKAEQSVADKTEAASKQTVNRIGSPGTHVCVQSADMADFIFDKV